MLATNFSALPPSGEKNVPFSSPIFHLSIKSKCQFPITLRNKATTEGMSAVHWPSKRCPNIVITDVKCSILQPLPIPRSSSRMCVHITRRNPVPIFNILEPFSHCLSEILQSHPKQFARMSAINVWISCAFANEEEVQCGVGWPQT